MCLVINFDRNTEWVPAKPKESLPHKDLLRLHVLPLLPASLLRYQDSNLHHQALPFNALISIP